MLMTESRTNGQGQQRRAAPAPQFDYSAIPQEWKAIPHWLGFRLEPDEKTPGRMKKTPKSPRTGYTSDPHSREKTWSTFDDALAAVSRYGFTGIGFSFAETELFGIDIDHKSLNDPIVQEFLSALPSYAEISQSGNGIHIICKGHLPGKAFNDSGKSGIEMYDASSKKYFACTGRALPDHSALIDCSEAVKPLYAKYAPTRVKPQPSAQMTLEAAQKPLESVTKPREIAPSAMHWNGQLSDDEVLKIAGTAQNGEKFLALWHGDIRGYNSHSEADAALCCLLAFYTGKDAAQIDRLFRQSSLMREKWDRPQNGSTYAAETIAAAIDKTSTTYQPKRKRGRPSAAPQQGAAQTGTQTAPKSERAPLTIEALDSFLTVHGIRCRFNDVTHSIEYDGIPAEYDGERAQAQAPTVITSMLRAENVKGSSLQIVSEYLDVISNKHHFNPVTELLDAVKWDGQSRIGTLFDIMRLPAEDELSRRLLFKWMMQALALCCMNNARRPFGADGLIVLTGKQGYGKTSLARKLGISPELFKAGLAVDPRDKDSVLKATSCFIAELGEIETTMKRDIPALKAFITDEKDEVRRPYARASETHIRRTSFIATCNSSDFLLDTTGNRRFWTIPCEMPFNLAALDKLDVLQLWAEIYEAVKKDVQVFRLSRKEQEQLNERNGAHTALIPAQAEILDILETARRNPANFKTAFVTVSEFASWYPSLKRYDTRQIGKALEVCGIIQKQIKRNGNRSPDRVRECPIPNRHFDTVNAE